MKVLIVFYSCYGNLEKLAQAVAEGAREVAGAEVRLAYTGDTLTPAEVRAGDLRWQETAARLAREYPVVEPDDLRAADAVIFGSPTRFGNMTAQMKLLFDTLGPLWMDGSLVDKIGGAFTSSATMHGGQESTLLSMHIPMMHLGMIIAGVPYSEPLLLSTTRGGTPYGPSAVVGPLSDQAPNETELGIARTLGRRVATLTGKLRG